MKYKPIEHRVLAIDLAGLELRETGTDQAPQLVGHASVFNQWATITELWGESWEESVAPGAYKKTIAEADIRALWNHDPNVVLGRNKANTLTLGEDVIGLAVTITPPDSEWGRPVLEAVRRGDVSGMSIAFQVVKDEWTRPDRKKEPNALPKRLIREARLLDVSPVTFPVFSQTDINARAENSTQEHMLLEALQVVRMTELGLPLESEERVCLRAAATRLLNVSGEPGAGGANETPPYADHSPAVQDNEPDVSIYVHSEMARARKLQLMKMNMEVMK